MSNTTTQLVSIISRGTGTSTQYRPAFAKVASKLCRLGATNADLADMFEVSLPTIANWQIAWPEFQRACQTGKDATDERVQRSLAMSAQGYSVPTEKVFCNADGKVTRVETSEFVPPNPVACIFWLKNRRPKEWRDRRELEHSGGVVNFVVTSDDLNL